MDGEMTIAQLQRKYDGEWILMADPKVDEGLRPTRGKVISHNPNRDVIDQDLLRSKPKKFAIFFAGKMPKNSAVII